jgi:hypothetical protein
MREELFDQLIESVKQMKEIQRGRRKASRTVRTDDLLSGAAPHRDELLENWRRLRAREHASPIAPLE